MQRSSSCGSSQRGRINDIVHVPIESLTGEITSLIAKAKEGSVGAFKFKLEYLEKNIVTKYNDGTGDDSRLRAAAYDSFAQGEQTCADVNNSKLCSHVTYGPILERARRIVSSLIGSFSYEKVLVNARHGSGATAIRPRHFGNAIYKYMDRPMKYWSRTRRKEIQSPSNLACTPLALKYWLALLESTPMLKEAYADNNVSLVRGNKLDFVPKNNRTHRTIAKEPCVNMFLQLGVGEYLASRLSLFGNSKYDQTRNQELARLGSVYGHMATIDLERASDSLSWNLVHKLLPADWFEYLDSIRSHYYLCPITNSYKEYNKFSTMGNGFTFELQTIIFYALALASSEVSLRDDRSYFSTYGDDIIVPSCEAASVIEVLQFCGFSTNTEKTFITGPFRESCGKHYYHGRDVTPFYIRKPIDSIVRLIWLLNSIRKWSYDEEMGVCTPVLESLWFSLYRQFRTILKKVRGGHDLDSTSMLVSPGTPYYQVTVSTRRIAICDKAAYVCKMAQGLQLKSPPLRLVDSSTGRIIGDFELYHYLIHPEQSNTSQFRLTKLHDHERLPFPKFVTELGK